MEGRYDMGVMHDSFPSLKVRDLEGASGFRWRMPGFSQILSKKDR